MSFPIARNPSCVELLRLAGPDGAVRAIRDPAASACLAWLVDEAQLTVIDAGDLAGMVRAIEGQLGGG